jgi:ABC-type antimicrobial peptide transport system permease subunit
MVLFKVALLNLSRRKSRTFLALLGIIVGISALTILISLVDGLSYEAEDTISKMQGIMVWDKSVPDQTMSLIDVSYENKLKSIPGVKKSCFRDLSHCRKD